MKKFENKAGEYITPCDVDVFDGHHVLPENKTWEEVASPIHSGYRRVIRKRVHKKGADNKNCTGVINPFGKIIIPMEYRDITACFENTFVVYKNEECALKDTEDSFIIPFGVYDDIGSMSEGVACVLKEGKMGFIDRFGRIVIDFQYEVPKYYFGEFRFVSGCCVVLQSGKYGVIDHYNNVIIPFKWDSLEIMCGDRIIVRRNIDFCDHVEGCNWSREVDDACRNCYHGSDQRGIINFKGDWILPLAKRWIQSIGDNLWQESVPEYTTDSFTTLFVTPDGIVPIGDMNLLEYWTYVYNHLGITNSFSVEKLINDTHELSPYRELIVKIKESGILEALDLDVK